MILSGSEACCLKESKIRILMTERSIERAICGVQVKDRKRAKDLMLVLGLNKTMDQLAITNSVHVEERRWSFFEGIKL